MDIFKELLKQSSKILNNISNSVDDITLLASDSASSAGNLIVAKRKLEAEKNNLNQLYRELGKSVVNEPENDYAELIKNVKALQDKVDEMEKNIESYKNQIRDNTTQMKDKITQGSEEFLVEVKNDTTENLEQIKETVETEADKVDKKVLEEIEKIKRKLAEEKNKGTITVETVEVDETNKED